MQKEVIQFSDAATKDKYEALVDTDRMVHKAGLYSGMLSDITPEMAEAFISGGTNLIKAKATSAVGSKAETEKPSALLANKPAPEA